MKKFDKIAYFIAAGAFLLASSQAQGAELNCTQVEDARERLACFDQQFPREPKAESVTSPLQSTRTEATSIDDTVAPAATVEATTVEATTVESTTVQATTIQPTIIKPETTQPPSTPQKTQTPETSEVTQNDDVPFTTSKGGFFDRPKQITVESTVVAIKDERQKKMVFRLENGQIWLQNSPRSLPIKSGEKVTIKSALVGGYILRSENGTSTRVRRIK
jgi:hypothetical protein